MSRVDIYGNIENKRAHANFNYNYAMLKK